MSKSISPYAKYVPLFNKGSINNKFSLSFIITDPEKADIYIKNLLLKIDENSGVEFYALNLFDSEGKKEDLIRDLKEVLMKYNIG